MFVLSLIINVDHGALPAALSDISKGLGLKETVMGTMGSAVFFGLIIGSMSASFVFKKFSYKSILVSSLVLNGISLLLFTAVPEFNYMCIARLIAGFSQIFITIYLPLFVDAYIKKNLKPSILALLLVAAPLGVVAGYTMTSICILKKGFWKSDNKYYYD